MIQLRTTSAPKKKLGSCAYCTVTGCARTKIPFQKRFAAVVGQKMESLVIGDRAPAAVAARVFTLIVLIG
jgi:hypothetical protein